MTNKIAEIALLSAAFMLCAGAADGARFHPYVHRLRVGHAFRPHGAPQYQGRSGFAPAFPFPPAEHGVTPYGYAMGRPCMSRDDCDRKDFDEFGTRGRMGLGADPAHPEGPGNFSD